MMASAKNETAALLDALEAIKAAGPWATTHQHGDTICHFCGEEQPFLPKTETHTLDCAWLKLKEATFRVRAPAAPLPHVAELALRIGRLHELLAGDPQPGLATWHRAVHSEMSELIAWWIG